MQNSYPEDRFQHLTLLIFLICILFAMPLCGHIIIVQVNMINIMLYFNFIFIYKFQHEKIFTAIQNLPLYKLKKRELQLLQIFSIATLQGFTMEAYFVRLDHAVLINVIFFYCVLDSKLEMQ